MASSLTKKGARFNDHLKGLQEEFELLSNAASTNSSRQSRFSVYLQRLKGEFDIMAVELDSFQKERKDYEAIIEAQAKELKDVRRNVVCEKCGEGAATDRGILNGPTTSGGVNMTGKTRTGRSRPSLMQKLLVLQPFAVTPTRPARSIIFNNKGKREVDVVHTSFDLSRQRPIRCLKFSQDGKYFAAGCQNTAYIYDAQTKILTCTLRNLDFSAGINYVSFLCFSHDGKYLAASSSDSCIYIWEISTKQLWKTFKGHTQYIFSLDFSPNSRLLVSASYDSTVRLWDHKFEQILTDVNSMNFGPGSVVFSPDGRYVAASCSSGMARIWEVHTGQLVGRVKAHVGWTTSVRFMPDGGGLVSGGHDKNLRFWDVRSLSFTDSWDRVAEPKLEFPGHEGLVCCLAVSPDGRLIASGSDDRTVRIWDTRNAAEQCILAHNSYIQTVDFSPAGDYLASVGSDGTVAIWRYSYISPGLDGSDLPPSTLP